MQAMHNPRHYNRDSSWCLTEICRNDVSDASFVVVTCEYLQLSHNTSAREDLAITCTWLASFTTTRIENVKA